MTYLVDKGAIFENFVMLELWRSKKLVGSLQFYRTTDGTAVDFILNQLKDVLAIECKYKNLEKPVSIAGMNNFCQAESIEKKYIVNLNLNATCNNAKLIQGYLVDRITDC